MRHEFWYPASGFAEHGLFKEEIAPLYEFERKRPGPVKTWSEIVSYRPGRRYGKAIDWGHRELVVRDDVRIAMEKLAPGQFQPLPILFDGKKDIYWIMNRAVVSDAVVLSDKDLELDRPPEVNLRAVPRGVHALTGRGRISTVRVISYELKSLLTKFDSDKPRFRRVRAVSRGRAVPAFEPGSFRRFGHPLTSPRPRKPAKAQPARDVPAWLAPLFACVEAKTAVVGKPGTPKMVAKLEDRIDLPFTDRLREFLQFVDFAVVHKIRISGRSSTMHRGRHIQDMVTRTKANRKHQDGFPPQLLFIAYDSGYFLLDTRAQADGDCPVVRFDPGDKSVVTAALSFQSWLTTLCETGTPPTSTSKRSAKSDKRAKPSKTTVQDVPTWLRPLASIVAADQGMAGTGATQKQIAAIGRGTQSEIPDRYREFLSTYGWAIADGVEILGIGTAASRGGPSETATSTTKKFRRHQHGWPAGMLAFCEDGRGGCICLDLSRSKGTDCPVFYYDHELQDPEADPIFERVAPSFRSWLRELCTTGEMPMP